jgi:hypothetical protein
MKKRYIYSLLFGLPGLLIAGIIAIVFFAGLAGILWIYVLGDDPWPAWVEGALSALFVLAVLFLWFAIMLIGFFVGKQLEKDPALNRNHVLISIGLTVLLALLMVLHQWSAGSLGRTTDSLLCSDFCVQHGFSGSGIPSGISGDRTCSCYDSSGDEALRIPLDHLEFESLK